MSESRQPAQTLPSETGGRLKAPPLPATQEPPVLPRVPPDSMGTTPAPEWNCQTKKAEDGPELSDLTVGAKFLLHCEGSSIPPWTAIPPLAFAKPEDEFSLVVLDVQNAGANSAELVVTGYKPGQYSGLVTIGAGANQVKVNGLKWELQTSIQVKEGEQPKPYPPFGPVVLYWPWWLWTGLGLGILLLAALIWWRLRRKWARHRLIEMIKKNASVLSPSAQFHKDLRALLRRYEGMRQAVEDRQPQDYLQSLNKSFRTYLAVRLLVPANEWSDAAILRDIRKRHKKLYKNQGKEIYGILREFNRGQKSQKLSFTDCHQLHEMCRKQVEKIEQLKGAQ